MYKEFFEAFCGRQLWHRIQSKFRVDKYIIMPHDHEEYNQYALEYLQLYLKKEGAQSAVIISYDSNVLSQIKRYRGEYDVRGVKLSKAKIMRIMRFYALYEFSKAVTIISLTIPYNTCGENLIGVHGTTKRELLCYDIYRFKEIPENNSKKDI